MQAARLNDLKGALVALGFIWLWSLCACAFIAVVFAWIAGLPADWFWFLISWVSTGITSTTLILAGWWMAHRDAARMRRM